MTINQDAYELAVSHAIGLQRYGAGTVKRVLSHLSEVEKDTLAKLASSSDLNRQNLEGFLVFLRARIETYRLLLQNVLQQDMLALSAYEADYQTEKLAGLTGTAFNRPTSAQLVAVVNAKPMQGRLLKDWAIDLSVATQKNIQDAVNIGITEGEGTDRIIKRIRGTRLNGYKDGVIQTSRRQAEAVVRTMVNHTANYAREAVYAENEQYIDGVMWSSVLDARTSEICQARDGMKFKVNEGPRPPAHINCRSTTIPIFDGVPLPDRITYNQWLKKQSFSDQVEILGKTRAALFNAGGLSVDKFVDSKGYKYTLDELRKRDRAAFEKAGLTKG